MKIIGQNKYMYIKKTKLKIKPQQMILIYRQTVGYILKKNKKTTTQNHLFHAKLWSCVFVFFKESAFFVQTWSFSFFLRNQYFLSKNDQDWRCHNKYTPNWNFQTYVKQHINSLSNQLQETSPYYIFIILMLK